MTRSLLATWFVLGLVYTLGPFSVQAQRTAVPRSGATGAAVRAARVAAFGDAASRRTRYLPGQVLVKFRAGVPVTGRQRALSALRSRPSANQLRWIGNVAVVEDPSQPDARVLAAQLSEQPEVEYAQPNYIRRRPGRVTSAVRPRVLVAAAPQRLPNDPDYAVLQWNFPLIGMPGAWAINPGGASSVIVATVDTGVTTTDTTLTQSIWTGNRFETKNFVFGVSDDLSASRFVGARDFVQFDAGGPVLDFDGHGTHVMSTITEDANNESVLGIAYRTRIMPLKACVGYWEIMLERAERGIPGFVSTNAGGCSDDAVAEAIRYAADNGAKVINLSLGGPEAAPVLRDALVYAVTRGAFVALAMGNGYEDGNPAEFPAAYAPGIEGVMSVGAVGKSEKRAYYSTTGATEIAAPGGDDRDGGGEDRGFVWQVTLNPADQDPSIVSTPRFDRYAEVGYEGTSMASPHVAGVAALLMSQGDLRDPKAIEAFIKATAKDLGTARRDDEFGYGLVQARLALRGVGIVK